MKTVTIIARDKNKVELGHREVDKPENWDEFVDTFDREQIMKYTWSAFAIEIQGELRNDVRSPSGKSEIVNLVKKLTPEQEAKLKEYMGIILK